MARKKRSKPNPLRNRASRLRAKAREGAELSVEELEFLRAYELTKRPAGRPKKESGSEDTTEATRAEATDAESEEPGDESDESDESDDGEGELAAAGDPDPVAHDPAPASPAATPAPAASAAPLPPRPPRVKLAPPPRVRTRVDDPDPPRGGGGGKEDWRAKYRGGGGHAAGREVTVTEIAGRWRDVLQALADGIAGAGIKPLVDPQQLYPSLVLVVDEILPAHVELTPKMIALGGTTVLVVQRFVRRAEIAEAQKKADDAKGFRERTQERRERAERAQEESARAADESREPGVPADPIPPAAPADPVGGAAPAVDVAAPVNGHARATGDELLALDPSVVF